MLVLKLIVLTLGISTGVLGVDIRRVSGSFRSTNDEYKYNHPPVPESYTAVPVAVVYENESSREEKTLKSNVTPEPNTIEVSKLQLKTESSKNKESSNTETDNSDGIEIKKSTKAEKKEYDITTYRPQKEQQIPVAVVYEPEPIYKQAPRPTENRAIRRRRPQKPVAESKDNDSSTERVVAQVNGHTGPGYSPTFNNKADSNKRWKDIKVVPKQQDVVQDNSTSKPTSYKTHNKEIPAPIETKTSLENKAISNPGKIDKLNNMRNFQKPGTIEAQIPSVSKIISNPTVSTQEQLNKRRNIQPLKEELKIKEENRQTPHAQESNKDVKHRTEQVNTDNAKQFPKRDNSTRVREVIPIVQSENAVYSQSGNFQYSYEGGDGTKAFETGELKMFDDETAGEAVSGGFSFKAKDGNEYSLSYTADENGYRPVGAHLPTPPPIPPAIARALAYLATKTTPEPVTESLAENH